MQALSVKPTLLHALDSGQSRTVIGQWVLMTSFSVCVCVCLDDDGDGDEGCVAATSDSDDGSEEQQRSAQEDLIDFHFNFELKEVRLCLCSPVTQKKKASPRSRLLFFSLGQVR